MSGLRIYNNNNKIYIISASRYKNIIIKVFNKVGLKTLREKVIFVKMLILKIIYF